MLTEFHWHLLGMSMCVVYKQQTIIINCSAQKLGKYAAITSIWPICGKQTMTSQQNCNFFRFKSTMFKKQPLQNH